MADTLDCRPELSADWSGEHDEKSAAWFELFLDLVMVAAFSSVAQKLKIDFTINGYLTFILIATLYVSSWHAYTHFNGRFNESSLVHYFFLYGLLVGIGIMVLSSKPSFRFTMGLLVTRIAVICMNLAVYNLLPKVRDRLREDIALLCMSIFVLCFALLVEKYTIHAYILVIIIEVILHYEIRIRHWFVRPATAIPVNTEHVREREASLVLVALGEAVVSAVVNTQRICTPLSLQFYAMMQLSMLITFSMAAFYFAVQPPGATHTITRTIRRASYYTMLHVILVCVILSLGVSMKFIADAVFYDRLVAIPHVGLLYGSMIICMLLILGLRWLHYWDTRPSNLSPFSKRIIFWWWGVMFFWLVLPLLSVISFIKFSPGGVHPLTALGIAAACMVVWLVTETFVMHYLSQLNQDASQEPELSPLILAK
ncbi:hypothetical protein THRCLA_03273 [Thraustotheca clavata]|uniref:Low temperature requirement protein A n=1 Tax=Thraustotheca clavata TaxID=74557 RepID=A0A1W0A2V0_9STRA|nr:hypothetical protein THRCLA_03273 [Thraustotheca clavata]